jgi:hypothetical protein
MRLNLFIIIEILQILEIRLLEIGIFETSDVSLVISRVASVLRQTQPGAPLVTVLPLRDGDN